MTLFIRAKDNLQVFRVIPLSNYKTTHKQQLKGEKLKKIFKWDEKLNNLSDFGWAVLFSCPAFKISISTSYFTV